MSLKLSQFLRAQAGVPPQDITTARTGPYVDVSGAQRLLALIIAGALADTKTITVQLKQATDPAGTGAKNLGDPVTITAASGGSPSIFQAVDVESAAKLDSANGYDCVAISLSSNNGSAIQGGAALVLGDNRYNP